MRLPALVVLAALVSLTRRPPAAAQTAAPRARDSARVDSALVNEVDRLIRARLVSATIGDTAAFHQLIAPALVHINDSGNRQSGAGQLRIIAHNVPERLDPASPAMPRFTITVMEARLEGPVLLADALVVMETPAGSRAAITRWRETNAFVRANGQWRLTQHAEVPLQALGAFPVVAAPDSAALGEFVGDYEWWPGVVDRISQRGAHLYQSDANHPEWGMGLLRAAGAEAFYPEDDSSGLAVFVRDSTGRVTHYITRLSGGPLVIARKIR